MSLNFDLTKIRNFKSLCYTGEEGDIATGKKSTLLYNPVTEALAFRTMIVGINKITEKNIEEFAQRCRAIDRVFGAPIHKHTEKGAEPYYITEQDVAQHVGLSTNASNKTAVQFYKDLGRMSFDKAKDEIVRERGTYPPQLYPQGIPNRAAPSHTTT